LSFINTAKVVILCDKTTIAKIILFFHNFIARKFGLLFFITTFVVSKDNNTKK